MPELPEVEVAVRVLRAAALGRTIVSVGRSHATTLRALSDDHVRALLGRRIARIERRGKHQLLMLDDGTAVHAHFRMAGDWHVGRVDDPPPPYARATLDLDDGTRVTLVDSRALASLEWRAAGASMLPELGPEPIDDGFDGRALRLALQSRRGPIKPALLDQRVVAGVGNIYAVEALWQARISPRASANGIGPPRLARLAAALRDTLRRAIETPGRYGSGQAPNAMAVYDREGDACARCGATIQRIVQSGRSTFFCARCQAR